MERRILIIDDDTSMLDTLRAELESRGNEVAVESAPEVALRRLAEGDFSVVLTDINMKGMSGVDLCQEVVSLREGLPIRRDDRVRQRRVGRGVGTGGGPYDFVTKGPSAIDRLVVTIRARAGRHR